MIFLIRLILFALIIYWLVKTIKKHFQTLDNQQQSENHFEPKGTKDPYQILEVSKNASQEDIKKAYRTALAQYHPDKVNHLGEDIKRVAQQKTQDIQWAYERLKK